MKKILTLLALCAASCTPLPAQNTLAGNLTVQQAVKLTGAASPAQLTSNANDYAPAGFATAAVLRIHADVPRTITGLAGGVAGRMVWLTNVGSQTITLATESASSTAANRFAFGASGFDLPAGGSLSIWYDTASSRWRAATNLAAGGGGTTVDQTARDAAAAAQATADSKQDALINATTLGKITESAGLPLWDGAAWPGGGSGGTGTVTNVSVVSANGVSGSVATASTTPAITLSLGAIAPTSVAASGTVTGSNLSGTNTGDQTSVMGNAGTATKLATARAINGVSFDGTANITVPAAAGTLTGTTLASGVTASSLTSAAGGSFGTAAFTAATAYDSAGAAAAITLAGLGGVPTSRTVNGHALSSNVTVTPSDLLLAIGTNTQAWSAKLDTVAALAAATGWLHNDGAGVLAWSAPSKSDIGLGTVENTPLSTWTGSTNLSTVGTITAGTWHGTALADAYVASAATWNAKVSFPGFGTTGTTAAVGNDSRLSDARTPLAHNQAWSTITSTPTTLAGYAISDAQPLDSDLTSIAALTTTSFGRALLTQADAAATRATIGAGTSSFSGAYSSLTGIPSTFAPSAHSQTVSTISDSTTVGQNLVRLTNPGAVTFPRFNADNTISALAAADFRSAIGAGTSLFDGAFSSLSGRPTTLSGYGITDAQGLDADLTALAGLSTTGIVARTGAGTASTRTITGTADQVIVTNGDGVAGNPTLALPQSIATTSTPQFARIGVGTSDTDYLLTLYGTTGDRHMAITGTSPGLALSNSSYPNAGTKVCILALSTSEGSFGMPSGDVGLLVFGSEHGDLNLKPNYSGATGKRVIVHSALTVTGSLLLSGYGAGTLVTDSSGNVTASSDRRLKDVGAKFTRGLDDVVKIQPRFYTWKPESGMNTDDVNVGFIAQDVQDAIPEAVGSMKTVDTEEDDGTGKKVKKSKRKASEYLTLSDRPIIATLVNAVKELKVENDDLRARVSALENRKAAK